MKASILILTLATIPLAHAVRCSDFSDKEEALKYHDEHGDNTSLDRDKDGEACECLEGGSAYGNSRCNH